MRIAQVVPLQIAVPPHKYGGTERVVANLTEALVKLGHDVTLFATADSITSAKLVPMLDREIFFNPEIDATAHHVAMLHEIYTRRAGDFDVIHSHLDYLTLPFTRLTATPTVLTLHGRLDHDEYTRVFRQYPEANYVSISDDQRRPIPDLNWVSTVHHGVDVDSFKPSYKHGDYLCFVGRMSREKRPDLAIEVAKRTGMKLKIAAKVDHKEEPYFKAEIEPLLDHPLIEWLGEVDEQRKRELMASAYALILPIDWPEPFGMVFIEALACGTPVVACPRGSVPEILKDGQTGFSGCTVDELVEAVRKIKLISRRACRDYAKRRFDTRRMALEYLNVYAKVQGRDNLFREPEPFVTESADDRVERVALP
jgi:glycosyltransferase involved in cell wall biosynthesis